MLIRVKVGSEILFPCRKGAGEQPLFGKQMAPRTAPSAGLEKTALMPQVTAGLSQYVGQEKHSDGDHPAFTPNFIATHGAVNIKRHASVFGFFAGMPHPQGLQPLWRLRQKVRVVEQPCSENRGVVFVGSSDGHRMNGFLLVDVGNAAKGAFFPMVDHSLVQDMLVEALVDTTVGGFLTNKAFDIFTTLTFKKSW